MKGRATRRGRPFQRKSKTLWLQEHHWWLVAAFPRVCPGTRPARASPRSALTQSCLHASPGARRIPCSKPSSQHRRGSCLLASFVVFGEAGNLGRCNQLLAGAGLALGDDKGCYDYKSSVLHDAWPAMLVQARDAATVLSLSLAMLGEPARYSSCRFRDILHHFLTPMWHRLAQLTGAQIEGCARCTAELRKHALCLAFDHGQSTFVISFPKQHHGGRYAFTTARSIEVTANGGACIGMVIGSQYPRVGVAFSADDLPCLPDDQFYFSFQLSKLGDSLNDVAQYLDPSTYHSLSAVHQSLMLMQSMLQGY